MSRRNKNLDLDRRQPQWHRRKRTAAGKWWRQQAAAQSTDAK